MTIFDVFTLFGGLAFFLFGMNVMSSGLEKMTNGGLEKTLRNATKSKFFSLVIGAAITIAIQSSSALTVMLVGLVNSGIMMFNQTIGVLMGSNIGTTLTAWILSLAGVEGDSIWLKLLKPANFAPVFAFIGIAMIMLSKKEKTKSTGNILVGFAVLMYGMTLMSDAMKPLSAMPEFQSLLTAFKNPFLAVIVGALFTGIIQSSAASVAILQSFSISGGITYGIAIPIIMGQNIGTCVTAVLSSIGVSKNAKKVAVVHLSFNIIGTIIFLIPFCIFYYLLDSSILDREITPFQIAIVHSIFNIATTFLLLPFTKQLEKIANLVIKDKDATVQNSTILDERLITVPSFAVANALEAVSDMAQTANIAFTKSIGLLEKFDEDTELEVIELEQKLDNYEDKVGTYMIKLNKTELADADSKVATKILHTINDFERIGDHAKNIVKVAAEINNKNISFSKEAREELAVLTNALIDIVGMTTKAFRENDLESASSVEPLEQVIDSLIASVKSRHVERLQRGECTIELGFILTDLITDYERVSDHCSNIAVAVIESQHGTFDTHEYLGDVKRNSGTFELLYHKYEKQYKFK